MKKCSLFLLAALSAATFANDKALSPNYRDYFTVTLNNMAPSALLLDAQGSLTIKN